jgi:hypothetical protein
MGGAPCRTAATAASQLQPLVARLSAGPLAPLAHLSGRRLGSWKWGERCVAAAASQLERRRRPSALLRVRAWHWQLLCCDADAGLSWPLVASPKVESQNGPQNGPFRPNGPAKLHACLLHLQPHAHAAACSLAVADSLLAGQTAGELGRASGAL